MAYDEQKMCWADVALSDAEDLDETRCASSAASSATSCEWEGAPMWYPPAPAPHYHPHYPQPYGAACPLVGVVVVCPEPAAPAFHEPPGFGAAPWHTQAQAPYGYTELAGPLMAAAAPKPSGAAGRAEPLVAAPAPKPLPQQGEPAPAAVQRKGRGRGAAGRASRLAGRRRLPAGSPAAEAGRSRAAPVPEPPQIPEASEETWQRRLALRIKAVDLVKQTREYARFAEQRRSEGDAPHEPPTPNPADRTTSKRRFKFLVQSWRNEILKTCGDDGQLSTVSTQDLPSLADHRDGYETALE